jgi:hypothetical protein
MANPYQSVIDWLHTPAGEKWSENRIAVARHGPEGETGLGPNNYGDGTTYLWKGIMSLKTDDKSVGWHWRPTEEQNPV